METFSRFVETLNQYLWGPPMILLLLGTHLFMTWKTGFIQRKTPLALRLSFSREAKADGDISPFAALATSLASTLGTGNIIGVGTAIALGGPGAVFWCWLTGVFGMATTYAESLIALKYRVVAKDGRMLGGAMYALERRLHCKPLALLFAFFGVLTSFGIGCSVQVNSIASLIDSALKDATAGKASFLARLLSARPDAVCLAVGLITGLITCAVILGGVQSISKVCQSLVPFMTLFYLSGCAVILYVNRHLLLQALLLILRSAFFQTEALVGGLAGSGILLAARYGIARGLFSNEAGMGSAPLIASAARTQNPARQALIASTATFWDTVVMCFITGLVLVSSILAGASPAPGPDLGGRLTAAAFSQIPYVGEPFLILAMTIFAYATILGWSYYGERCLEYLCGNSSFFLYRFLWIMVLVFSPLFRLELVFSLADVLNALMALPNLLALFLLSNEIAEDTRRYLEQEKGKT